MLSCFFAGVSDLDEGGRTAPTSLSLWVSPAVCQGECVIDSQRLDSSWGRSPALISPWSVEKSVEVAARRNLTGLVNSLLPILTRKSYVSFPW